MSTRDLRCAGGSAAMACKPLTAATSRRARGRVVEGIRAVMSVASRGRGKRGSVVCHRTTRTNRRRPDTGWSEGPQSRFRRAWITAGVTAVLVAVPSPAITQEPPAADPPSPESQAPDQVATAFLDAVAAHRWANAAGLIHPETLDLFQYRIVSVLNADTTGRFARSSFGVEDGPSLRGRSAERLFADLLAAVNRDTPALMAILATNAYQPVGWVPEAPDLGHAVLRVTPYTNGDSPTHTLLVTARQTPDGWRVLDAEVLDALSTAITGLAISAREGR